MVDATGGTGGGPNFAEMSEHLDIQDNTLDTSILADVDPVLSNAVENLEESFHERMAHLEHQLENTDNPQQKLALEEEMQMLEGEFESFENRVESGAIEFAEQIDGSGTIASVLENVAGMRQELALEALEDMVGDFRSTLADSYAQFGTADMPPDLVVSVGGDLPIGDETLAELGGPCQVPADTMTEETGQTQGTEASGEIGGAEQTDGAGETGETDGGAEAGDLADPEEMVNLLSSDPQAFMEELGDMDPEDRNTMMMAVQTQMQEINQMFQMASQFSQAMHDTQTSVIQNMRV